MSTKAFSIEDGNLQNKTLISSRTVLYNDIDMTFANKPSGDVYKKSDAAAVKQAIKNLLLTSETEKPFYPSFGGGLNTFLFSLSEDFDEFEIEERIANAIGNYEPRARVKQVFVSYNEDSYNINVTVVFQILSTQETAQVEVALARLR